MRLSTKITICLGTLLFTGQAGADMYSYDFSTMGFSDGQDVEGLSLTSAIITSEGPLNMWYTLSYGGGLMANIGASADLYIDFSDPIDQITATAGNGAGDFDAYSLYLYEFGTDNYIGRWDTPVFGGSSEPQWYTLSVSASNVGRVVLDPGNAGSLPGTYGDYGGVVLTDLSYNVVPAPGAVVLGAIGLGLVGWVKRRFS